VQTPIKNEPSFFEMFYFVGSQPQVTFINLVLKKGMWKTVVSMLHECCNKTG